MEISKAFLTVFGLLLASMFALTQGTLTSASASEGSCLDPTSISDPTVWAFIFTYTGTWNIPMGNDYMFRKYAEILLGRPANDATELGQMNLTAQCTTLYCNLQGYDVNVWQQCSPNSLVNPLNLALVHDYKCPSIYVPLFFESDAAAWSSIQGPSPPAPIISVIYSDNVNTIVLNECIDGANRGFFVFSKSATLTSTQSSTISTLLVNAGYDSSHFYYQ